MTGGRRTQAGPRLTIVEKRGDALFSNVISHTYWTASYLSPVSAQLDCERHVGIVKITIININSAVAASNYFSGAVNASLPHGGIV